MLGPLGAVYSSSNCESSISSQGPIFWQCADDLPVVADGTNVTAWSERTGKANTTAPGAASEQPKYYSNTFGTHPGVRFDGVNDYMRTTSFVTAQPLTIVLVVKPISWSLAHRYIDGNTVNQIIIAQYLSPFQTSIYSGTAFSGNVAGNGIGQPMIISAVFSQSTSQVGVNGARYVVSASPGTQGIIDGLLFGGAGNLTSGFFAAMDMYAIAVFPSALSSTALSAIEQCLASKVGVSLISSSPQIFFDGDSLTAGLNGVNPYPTQCIPLLTYSPLWENLGVPSQTVADMTTNAPSRIDNYYTSWSTKHIVVAWGGTNDIFNGADDTTTYNRIVTYCQARRTAKFKVVVCNIIARGNFTAQMNTYKTSVNSSIAANWATFADAYVNLAGRAEFSDPNNTTYYQADKVHLTSTGNGIVASLVATALNAL